MCFPVEDTQVKGKKNKHQNDKAHLGPYFEIFRLGSKCCYREYPGCYTFLLKKMRGHDNLFILCLTKSKGFYWFFSKWLSSGFRENTFLRIISSSASPISGT